MSGDKKSVWFEDVLEDIKKLVNKEEHSIKNIKKVFNKVKSLYTDIQKIHFSTETAEKLKNKSLYKMKSLILLEDNLVKRIIKLKDFVKNTNFKKKEPLRTFKVGNQFGNLRA